MDLDGLLDFGFGVKTVFDGREKDSLLGNLWTVYSKLWNEGGMKADDPRR